MLILKRSPQQESALTGFLQDMQNPHSHSYHQFLTPEEFGTRYGASDSDLAAVRQWLEGQGFTVAGANKGRTAIEFSGTVGQVQTAFQTAIHRFNVGGTEHWANVTDPQIPVALAAVVGGVASLNDFKPLPSLIKGRAAKWNSQSHSFSPDVTVSASGNQYLFVGPGDAATIYDTPSSLNTRLASGQATYDGTGVNIGIAGTTQYDGSDISYRLLFGLPYTNNDSVVYDGNLDNIDTDADGTEAIADMEIAGAVAPAAHLTYYAAGDTAFQPGLFLAIYRAIDDDQVNILSVSYIECEAALGASGNLEVLNAWEQAAAQGITVTVASGDSGSAGCDNPNLVTAATQGFAVNGLASTPYNIAVGGTDFDGLSKNFSTYVGSNSSNFTSALSYIPENPWNDSTSSNGTLSVNKPFIDTSGETNIWAGGGGASSAADNAGGYPKPQWQQDFSPSNVGTVRDVPDVSLFSGDGLYGGAWALCEESTSDCDSGANSSIHSVGGTSTSTPAFAGILALVNQKVGAATRLGQANWVLYHLAQTTPSIFHSITTGNISVYCSSGSPNCGSNNFLSGYNAQSNYSMAVGLGSVDATLLVNHWLDDSFASTTTTLSLDKTTFQHGTPVTITAGVNPNAATGNIAITDNYASQPKATGSSATTVLALSAGAASGTFGQFPGGSYNVYANYGGDGTYGGSISQPVAVTVTPENSTLNFAVGSVNSKGQLVNASGATVPLGSLISVNAMPIGASQSGSATPVTNATGTVTFSDTATGYTSPWNAQANLDSTGTAEANSPNFQAGTHTITASYGGDLSYNASNAGPISFTVAKAQTSVSVVAASASTIGEQVGFTALVASPIPFNTISPTGNVTFTDATNNTVLGTGNASPGCAGNTSTACSSAYLNIDSTQLMPGANSIVASYTGDSNFNGGGPSSPVAVTCNASCWNAFGERLTLAFYQQSSGIISAGGTITTTVEVGESGGFTGGVNLTCTITGNNPADQHVPTCSFNPTTGTITTDPRQDPTSLLTISSTAPTTTTSSDHASGSRLRGAGAAMLASLLIMLVPGVRRRGRYLGVILSIVLTMGWMTACGGGGSTTSAGSGNGGGGGGTSTTIPGTTPDTYTVTFRAADAATGTVTAADYFTFKVN
jgi:trimeric autotransporter adhesin